MTEICLKYYSAKHNASSDLTRDHNVRFNVLLPKLRIFHFNGRIATDRGKETLFLTLVRHLHCN